MQKLISGQSAKIELVAGQALYMSGNGLVSSDETNLPAVAYQLYGWPITVGPFNYTRYLTIEATGALEFEVKQEQGIVVRLVQLLDADLPEVGDPGVIYETEAGWKRFETIDGTYKTVADDTSIPLAPVNDTAPVIAGEAEVDAVLTVTSNGVWDYRPTSFTYQWLIGAVEVEGETGKTFTVPEEAAGENVTCSVTAINAVDGTAQASNSIAIPSGD